MKPNSIIVPVEDMAAAVSFLAGAAGLALKFRDGDRYAAFEFGGLTLALVAGEERIADGPALAFRVEDMAAAAERLAGAGAAVLRPAEQGPHEVRAVYEAPFGLPLVISRKTV